MDSFKFDHGMLSQRRNESSSRNYIMRTRKETNCRNGRDKQWKTETYVCIRAYTRASEIVT
jgi:hypothetical protein